MAYSEKVNLEIWTEDKAKGMQKLKDAKVEIYNLPRDTAKWLVDAAYEATWAFQQKRFPDVTPRPKALQSGGRQTLKTKTERRVPMNSSESFPGSRKQIVLTVNGERVETDVGHRTTLAEFLREELDLTGTKVGCNRGECGSCTVIIDGMAVYSCTMLAVEAHGKEVLTIEGLADQGKLHPLQEAFVEHDALQCGYCTPGMILSVKALLDKNPHPSELDVRTAIDGNLCRCGSIPNIVEATLDASRKMAQGKGAE